MIFETIAQPKISILIGLNKKMKELIKFYFKIFNRSDLFGDQIILFLMKGTCIMHNSDEKIKTFAKNNEDFFVIIDDSFDDKIKRKKILFKNLLS